MSEAFPNAVGRVDIRKYVDQLEEELKKILVEVGSGKTRLEVEATQTRIQALLQRQASEIAKEMSLTGNHVLVFMTSLTVLTTAWVSFSIKRQTEDLSKPFEERLAMTEMLNALQLTLGNVISAGASYAELYGKK